MRRLGSITDSMDMNLSKLQEVVEDRIAGVLQSMESQRVRHNLATEQQQQWIKLRSDFLFMQQTVLQYRWFDLFKFSRDHKEDALCG